MQNPIELQQQHSPSWLQNFTAGIYCMYDPVFHRSNETYLHGGRGGGCRWENDNWWMTMHTYFVKQVMSSNDDFKKCLECSVDINKLKFYSIENCGSKAAKVSPELLHAQESVCQLLNKNFETNLTKPELPLLRHALYIWVVKMGRTGGPSFREMLFGDLDKPGKVYWEFLKWSLGLSDHTFPAIRLAGIESLKDLIPKSFEEYMLKNGEKLRLEVEEILGEDGVLLFPSHPTTALRHNVPIFKTNNFIYTAIFNALHLPVTQVPLGLDSKGLPMGIQVVAKRNNDHFTLAVAQVLERELGGWVQP